MAKEVKSFHEAAILIAEMRASQGKVPDMLRERSTMASEMVERVARALDPKLFDPQHTPSPFDFWADQARDDTRRKARAAIEAMREPTDKMLLDGFLADEEDRMAGGEGNEPVNACWRAMIDEALR